MMKKLISMLSAFAVLLALGVGARAETDSSGICVRSAAVYLNGTQLNASAIARGGRVYLPLRSLCESIGYTVQWSGSNGGNTITTVLDNDTCVIDIVNQTITRGKAVEKLEPSSDGAVCFISDGHSYLDSECFAKQYKLTADCDLTNSKVSVTSSIQCKNTSLNTGETFTVSLDGNPTTGYDWYYTIGDPGILAMSDSNYASKAKDSSVVGVGGTYTWTFKALKAGKTSVVFKYYRSWESKDALNIVVYNVTVK